MTLELSAEIAQELNEEQCESARLDYFTIATDMQTSLSRDSESYRKAKFTFQQYLDNLENQGLTIPTPFRKYGEYISRDLARNVIDRLNRTGSEIHSVPPVEDILINGFEANAESHCGMLLIILDNYNSVDETHSLLKDVLLKQKVLAHPPRLPFRREIIALQT